MSRKEQYGDFVRDHVDTPIFHQPWWLDVVSGDLGWDVAVAQDKSGRVEAVWPYVFFKRYNMNMLLQPLLTPSLGIVFNYPEGLSKNDRRYAFEKQATFKLLEKLPEASMINQLFHTSYTNWMPLYWKGFRQTVRYTHLIRDIADMETVRKNYKGSVRSDVLKAKQRYTIDTEVDSKRLYELNEKTFQRKNIKTPFTHEYFEKIVKVCEEKGVVEMNFAVDDKGSVVTGNMTVYDNGKAYNLVQGVDKSLKPQGAVQLVLDKAIERASSRVSAFDFEGSMTEEIERVFRSFGGELQPYFVISKIRNKILSLAYSILKE